MFGSSACCSKNIHCSASARSIRDSGASGVPPATYQRMAFDSARVASVRYLQQRHLSARVLGEKIRRAAFTAQNVDLDGMVGRVEQRQRKANLVAVSGALHRIEFVHPDFVQMSSQGPRPALSTRNAAKQ